MIAVEVVKNPDDFKCSSCAAKHCDFDGEYPDSIGPAPFERYEVPGVIKSRVCLLPMVTAHSRELLRLYGHYKNGVLIHAGGLYDQPHRYIQAMGVIDGATARN